MNGRTGAMGILPGVVILVLSGCGGGGGDHASTGGAGCDPARESLAPLDAADCDDGVGSPPPDVSEPEIISDARQWIPVEGQVDASGLNGSMTTYSATVLAPEGGEPAGTVSITDQGHFTYIPLTAEPATVRIEIGDGERTVVKMIKVENVASDPLAAQQWHLRNTGQWGFAMADSVYQAYREKAIQEGRTPAEAEAEYSRDERASSAGEDLNVAEAYALGATGQDTITVVVDTGLEIAHEDLHNNVLPRRSLNLSEGATDRTDPTNPAETGDHGTLMAGLIAAEGWNGSGGRGVSPDARLIGINLLGTGVADTTRNTMISYGMAGSGIGASDNVVSFNRGYGVREGVFTSSDGISDEIIRYPTRFLRGGLGALNIKANGDGFNGDAGLQDTHLQRVRALCELQQDVEPGDEVPLGCEDGNWDHVNASFYTLSVGALNANGKHSPYSTAGSNLWVSAPGGMDGGLYPAMVTTDQSTCLSGLAGFAARDAYIDDNQDELLALGIDAGEFFDRIAPFISPFGDQIEANIQCNYTNNATGTAAAAANTAGVANLIASANPGLSWREIRHILAVTATRVDPDDAPVVLPLPDGEFVAHAGWVKNAAGHWFNDHYGYGRPDAGAAVALAQAWQGGFSDLVETEWREERYDPPLAIPDNSASGTQVELEITEALVIEGMQFAFSIRNPDLAGSASDTTAASDIAIEVTSPAGTRAVIASSRNGLGADQVATEGGEPDHLYHPSSPLLSNAFYGEPSAGIWRVRVLDTQGADRDVFLNNTVNSTLEKVGVRVFGHYPESEK